MNIPNAETPCSSRDQRRALPERNRVPASSHNAAPATCKHADLHGNTPWKCLLFACSRITENCSGCDTFRIVAHPKQRAIVTPERASLLRSRKRSLRPHSHVMLRHAGSRLLQIVRKCQLADEFDFHEGKPIKPAPKSKSKNCFPDACGVLLNARHATRPTAIKSGQDRHEKASFSRLKAFLFSP